jgi:hypothetical protein
MPLIPGRAYPDTRRSGSQELRDSIEALRRYVSLYLPRVIRRSQTFTQNSQVILVIWNRSLEQSLFVRAWV